MAYNPQMQGQIKSALNNNRAMAGQAMPGMQQPPMGMFGTSATYTPKTSAQGPSSYDTSGIQAGANMLRNSPTYNPKAFNPYQFQMPNAKSMNPYGTTSAQDMGNIYNQAMSVATKPVMAQGQEAMRQLSQGFEGGRLGGAANAELGMKQAQATGSQLQDTSKEIGSQLAQSRLGEMQTARQNDYQEQQNLRNMQFQAAQDQQKNQAAENYQAAGFGDEQSKYMAQDALTRAQTMMGYGFQYPQMQAQLNNQQEQQYQNFMNLFTSMGGIS